MRKRKTAALTALVLSLILFVVCGGFLLHTAAENRDITRGYLPRQTELSDLYAKNTDLAAVKPAVYEEYLQRDASVFSAEQLKTFHLSAALHYYAHPGDSTPVLVQEAGTEVQCFPLRITGPNSKNELYVHYEMPDTYAFWYSLPTTQRGWRCTRALQTAVTAVDANQKEQAKAALPLYYVRTEELLAQTQTYQQQTLPESVKEDERTLLLCDLVGTVFYGYDQAFLSQGVFVSPDLLELTWSVQSIVLLVLAVAAAAAGLLLLPKTRAQREQLRREKESGPALEDSPQKVWGLIGFPRGKR